MAVKDYTPILGSIVSATATALTDAGVPVGLAHVSPGQLPAWDDCCAGQLYLRVIEVFPTAGTNAPFPQIDQAQRGAGIACAINMLAFHLGLGVMRCAHTVDEQGITPTATELTEDAYATMGDLSILLNVIVCNVPGITGVQQVKVGRWLPQGVLGGCVGGEWDFYIAVDPCLCQDA